MASLVEWRNAVLDATDGAERFLRSAVERYRLWLKEYGDNEAAAALATASRSLPGIASLDDLEALCKALAGVPLPVGFFSDGSSRLPRPVEKEAPPPPPAELSVAFLKFQIDGEAAANIHHLAPQVLHDLEIEVRVSRWPTLAERLRLSPVSTELRSTYDLSEFVFERPVGEAPFILMQRGRAVLQLAQGLSTRPYEFKYSAAFEPTVAEQPVSVVGHRTLLIEGLDVKVNPITGYVAVDQKLLKIRDDVRRAALVNAQELTDLLEILTVLGGLAGRAVQDAEFDGVWSEARFQDEVRKELRRNPRIGADLAEHPKAAGGITDLNFHDIVIELKSTPSGLKKVSDCQGYVEQTASYAVAKGKRVAVLCVLDCTMKTTAPLPAADGISILFSAPPAEIAVITILVQGNLTRPSKLSR
ncbi:hypothetical protein [Roseateles sp. LYH14W]|uniref:Restriction endonuclease n=1 Tax=Pelomonas parva TaxID=3299032 RepID=A0ABW7FD16_9BURK